MEVVLGVSMTPTTVGMVLVEGAGGDGVTLDTALAIPGADAADQVAAAILGTRESAAEGAHHVAAIGVAWTDHADGARLRDALRARDIDDIVMVSELHAASALAQAVGRRLGCARTALLFVERDDVTLAVVRTGDGAVVAARSRVLAADDPADELRGMVVELEHTAEPPEAVFLVGAGRDVAMLAERVADGTTLSVYAPDEAELALARGAALAAANAPRLEAATVQVCTGSTDTLAAQTQLAAAGYLAPLGYSAFDDDEAAEPDQAPVEAAEKPFLLVGSALAAVFVIGMAALVISLAIRISPVVEQRPEPPSPAAQQSVEAPPPPTIETIQAPRPVAQEVVQQAPRTVFVPTPVAVPPTPAPVAPVPVVPAPEVVPAATAPVPAAPPASIAPAPALPPIVLAPLIPLPLLASPIRIPAVPATPPSAPPVPAPPAPITEPATPKTPSTPTAQTVPPDSSVIATPTADSPEPDSSGKRQRRGGSDSDSRGSPSQIWPLWPSFGN